MGQFSDLLKLGVEDMVQETPATFIFRGNSYTGIFSDLSESHSLGMGGFEEEIEAELVIPFSANICSDPKHDERIEIDNKPYKVGRVTKDAASWNINLVSAR